MNRQLVAAVWLLGFCLLIGCSGSKTHGTVNGTVTLDGEPLSEGTVRFVPTEGDSQTASAIITDGQFVAEVPIGTVRMEYSAPKVMGKQSMIPGGPEVDIVGELLPARYNLRSELTMNVELGKNAYEIDLQSK